MHRTRQPLARRNDNRTAARFLASRHCGGKSAGALFAIGPGSVLRNRKSASGKLGNGNFILTERSFKADNNRKQKRYQHILSVLSVNFALHAGRIFWRLIIPKNNIYHNFPDFKAVIGAVHSGHTLRMYASEERRSAGSTHGAGSNTRCDTFFARNARREKATLPLPGSP